MANEKKLRLSGIARQLNVGQATLVDFLQNKGVELAHGPNTIVDDAVYGLIEKEFGKGKGLAKVNIREKIKVKNESVSLEANRSSKVDNEPKEAEKEVIVKSSIVDHAPIGPKIVGKIDLNPKPRKQEQPKPEVKAVPKPAPKPAPKPEPAKPEAKPVVVEKSGDAMSDKTFDQRMAASEAGVFRVQEPEKLSGPKIIGKIDLASIEKKSQPADKNKKNKRKRIKKDGKVDINDPKNSAPGNNQQGQRSNQHGKPGQQGQNNRPGQGGQQGQNNRPGQGGQHNNRPGQGGGAGNRHNRPNNRKQPAALKPQVSDEDVQKQIKDTLARLTSKGAKGKSSKYRRDKRDAINARQDQAIERAEKEKSILRLTEFVTVSDLAQMIDVQVTEVITACMNLGLIVSINQRLDAEAIVIVAEEFGYKVEFVSVEIQEAISSEEDSEADMQDRPPIVTVMGHVDHGKTSLLDFVRKTNVIAGEAGGITQHIGAYSVNMEDGRRITFLDTPGHEAFTAMRARGAKITDVAIIIVAADDSVMPQTIEAINHATAAGVPIVFAINKIDKPGANPDRIKEQLGAMNYLVEDWGGKYQCQEISAKQGLNVDKLLEKVLLEADILELKANPNKKATGGVIESSLDKGRGYVTTLLVQAGTLRVGDVMLSGMYTGRVKAMFNERGKKINVAPPATPVMVLGLNGAPQAGDNFNIMDDDRQAREIANKREQLQRIQGLKTQKHITLDEIGRRIAIGNFQELNVIVKGDVDGSVEALTGSLIKQSKESVQVNVIHKAVGQISESDVLLAAASNAVIIGFQVRPSASARRVAEKEEIEIRLYSIIYDAINDIKDAIEGMLEPEYKEVITCSVEVMETFKISKVGTIAGCLVREGKINRNTGIRIIRDGIVVYTGKLGSLKRYKDDAKEVAAGLECGLNIDGYNDIKVGDFVEGYEQVEVKRK